MPDMSRLCVATVGGGRYDLGAWAQWCQLRSYGYSGKYYLGYSDSQPLSDVWLGEPVIRVPISFDHGWQSKSVLVDAIPESTVLFLDADVYPLGPLPLEATSQVWPNIAGYCAIDSAYFGLPDIPRHGLDGGVWCVDKTVDAQVWVDYVDMSTKWRETYSHGFGDQDLLLVAWERAGRVPIVDSRPVNLRGIGRHSPSDPWPGFIHRWQRKLSLHSSHYPTLPDERQIRDHVRKYRAKLREGLS